MHSRAYTEIVDSIEANARAPCGYATLHDVHDKSQQEDRMESFFLSETLKYLYLLFDDENALHSAAASAEGSSAPFVLTTQAHVLRRVASAESEVLRELDALGDVLADDAPARAPLQSWLRGAWEQLKSGASAASLGAAEVGNATLAARAEAPLRCTAVSWRQRLSGALQPIERVLIDDFVAGAA